jgi:hypothetical protein
MRFLGLILLDEIAHGPEGLRRKSVGMLGDRRPVLFQEGFQRFQKLPKPLGPVRGQSFKRLYRLVRHPVPLVDIDFVLRSHYDSPLSARLLSTTALSPGSSGLSVLLGVQGFPCEPVAVPPEGVAEFCPDGGIMFTDQPSLNTGSSGFAEPFQISATCFIPLPFSHSLGCV